MTADDAATATATAADAVVKATRPKRSLALRVVTTSEIQTFRDCPAKHDFKYRRRLRTRVEGKALAIGHVFHRGMSEGLLAGWRNVEGCTVDQRLARQKHAAIAYVDTDVFEWVARVVQHDPNADYAGLQAFADDTGAMLKFMLVNYFERAKRDLTALVLLEVEGAFSVNVRDALGRKSRLTFDGVRDAVFYDPATNAIELHEHKTVSNMPEDIGKRAEMDPQTSGYMYSLLEDRAAGRIKFLDGSPVPADAILGRVAYNAVRKKKPSTPKVNKDGKVSVAAIDTLAELYINALDLQAAPVAQGGRGIPITAEQAAKAQELAGRGGAAYYARVEYQKTRAEIDRWRNDTFVDASRMRQADRDPRARTRNPGNCNMAWSMACEYRAICLDDTPEIAATYRVSEHTHPEVREAEEMVAGAAAQVSPF